MKTLKIMDLAEASSTEVNFQLTHAGQAYACEGLHKLLQSVVLYVSTAKGSIETLPEFGNAYIATMVPQVIVSVDTTDVLDQQFAALASDMLNYFGSTQRGLPLTEQLGSIDINYVHISDRLDVQISITSAAGAGATYGIQLISREI